MYEGYWEKKKKDYPGKAGVDKLIAAFNENPLLVIAIGAAAMTAAAKLIDAVSAVQGRRAYAKQINLKAKR
jgi:hypothetical protein